MYHFSKTEDRVLSYTLLPLVIFMAIVAFVIPGIKSVFGQQTLPLNKAAGLPTYEHRLITQMRNVWKQQTIKVLSEHSKSHKCRVTQKILPVLTSTSIFFYNSPNSFEKAFAAPSNNVDYSKIFINTFRNDEDYFAQYYLYSDAEAFKVLVHESIHNAFICGADKYKSALSICTLWGNPIYQTMDINKAIDEHYKNELSQMSKEYFK